MSFNSVFKFELDVDPKDIIVQEISGNREKLITLSELISDSYSFLSRIPHIYYKDGNIDDPDTEDKQLTNLIFDAIKHLYPKKLMNYVELNEHNYEECVGNIKFVNILSNSKINKYTPNNIFRDKNEYLHIIILIPPFCDELSHKGGLIKIYDNNNRVYEFESSGTTKINVIAFDPSFKYEYEKPDSGIMLAFEINWCYTNLAKLAKIHHKYRSTFMTELYVPINHAKNELAEKVNELNTIVSSQVVDIKHFKNTLKHISDKLTEIDEQQVRLDRYDIDNITNLKEYWDEKIAIIPLLNYYPGKNVKALYKNDLELFNLLRKTFGKVTIKKFVKHESYGTEFLDPGDKYISIDDLNAYNHGSLYDYNSYILISNWYLKNDSRLGFTERRWHCNPGRPTYDGDSEDDTYDLCHTTWYTCLIVNIFNFESIFTFVAIWQLRKTENPYLGLLPKDVIKLITFFVE